MNVIRNDLGIACLTMAFLSEEDMEFIEDSSTVLYPNGIAKDVVKSLTSNYHPADRLSAVEAETEMRGVKPWEKKDAESYFKRVAVVKSKYRKSKTFDEATLIANLMSNAPECYHDTLPQELRGLGEKLRLMTSRMC